MKRVKSIAKVILGLQVPFKAVFPGQAALPATLSGYRHDELRALPNNGYEPEFDWAALLFDAKHWPASELEDPKPISFAFGTKVVSGECIAYDDHYVVIKMPCFLGQVVPEDGLLAVVFHKEPQALLQALPEEARHATPGQWGC